MVDGLARTSRYEVLTKIATGGMATVYVGRVRGAVGFSRFVAVKRPHPFVTADADLKQQLEAEARVASMIHHPNVVSVLDVEEIDGELVLVMDYVEGCTLKALVDHAVAHEAPFLRVAVRVILDVAAGLHAAHRLRDATGAQLGVVHRDVSPQNVLLGVDGVARLTDFGIAKIASVDTDPTATDVMKGKMAYLAPEYIASRRFEARSDLFSLAVVAWEALAGERLFKGATTVETLMNIVDGRVPLLGTIRPELAPLQDVIAAALSRRPEDRPESVEAFATALEARARSVDGVATHAEVGALVEQAAGAVIAERRRVLESALPRALGEVASEAVLTDRDRMDTASLAATPSLVATTMVLADPLRSEEVGTPAPRRSRAPVMIAAFGLALAVSTTAIVVTVRRHASSGTTGGVAAAEPSADLADAAPLLSDLGDQPADSAGAGASAAPLPQKRPHPVRTPPRPGVSTLLPAHAPPNPYAK
jgi:eukaryotic-like serine/threonine-protein kinase